MIGGGVGDMLMTLSPPIVGGGVGGVPFLRILFGCMGASLPAVEEIHQ
jgi:hypothetical protein